MKKNQSVALFPAENHNIMTKQQEFALFKKECLKWAKRWGLEDWRYDFGLDEGGNTGASCESDILNHIQTLRLNKEKPFFASKIKGYAKHEMCHAMLGELRCLIYAAFVSEEEWVAAEHRVVIKLERLL